MSDLLEPAVVEVPYATELTKGTGLGTGPVSAESYMSPEFFERERKQVFGRAWLNMGRIEQLPKPNSYFVKKVEVCKAEVLVTIDQAGDVRAFHNVCTHRGNLLALDSCGVRKPFHLPLP